MTTYRYRYVPYGTNFESSAAWRTNARSEHAPNVLCANELAVDVGGAYWGYEHETRPVIDHHFFRTEGQFPSAAAAVLHNAERIHELGLRLAAEHAHEPAAMPDVFWLVAHQEPDFDAFSAMYLARAVLRGEVPHDGWREIGLHPDGLLPTTDNRLVWNWYRPELRGLPMERRWPIMLAAYAACVDNCRRVQCPKHRTLNSVLVAAQSRGRNFRGEHSGAVELFDEIARWLQDKRLLLNPMFDSVLERSETFAGELALLDQQLEAYERDVRRARRAVVYLQEGTGHFSDWFARVRQTPLRRPDGTIDPVHLFAMSGDRSAQRYRPADGIYLRDPDCLLFKDWARLDLDHSSMGRGFLFTAIAYSQGRATNPGNQTDYYFSLDPERAGGLHLYNVWARLQAAEITAAAGAAPRPPRPGYEGRAGGSNEAPDWGRFADPWFDGENYQATIVVTPAQGTLLPAGQRDDLADDPVAQLVDAELHGAMFVTPPSVKQRTVLAGGSTQAAAEASMPLQTDYLFGMVELSPDVDLLSGRLAEQIGTELWKTLTPDRGPGVPTDFRQRHLLYQPGWLAVWNRRGVIVAYTPSAYNVALHFKPLFDEAIDLLEHVRTHHATKSTGDALQAIAAGEELLRRAAVLRHALALPDQRVLQRFFATTGLDDLLTTLHDLRASAVERSQRDALASLQQQQAEHTKTASENLRVISGIQKKIEWLEVILIAVYISELLHVVVDGTTHHGWGMGYLFVGGGLAAAVAAWIFLKPHHHLPLTVCQRVILGGFAIFLLLLPWLAKLLG